MVDGMTIVSTPERRAALADALIGLIATRGIEAVSVREVAAAAGVSIGAVQYYFSTRSEMLAFAFAHAVQRTRDRLAAVRLTGVPQRDVGTVLSELLPLDEHRRAEAAVHLAFASLAATTPELQVIQRGLLGDIRAELTVAVGGDGRRAAMLLAVVDGLALHHVSAPGAQRPRELTATLDLAVAAALAQ